MRRKKDWRYWARLLPVALAGGLFIWLAEYVLLSAQYVSHPFRSPVCCLTPADRGFEYVTVTLAAPDGVPLAGWYLPSKNRAAVILLHGYGSNRLQMLVRGEMLARHGYGVLLYDMRAQGESGGKFGSNGWQDVDDVPAALAYLQARPDVDPQRIGILGFSVGGQVALRAAAEFSAIKAVAADGPSTARVEDSPPGSSLSDRIGRVTRWLIEWAVSQRSRVPIPAPAVEVIPGIAPRPVLLIASAQTELELEIARGYYARAGEPKELWGIPDAAHGEGPVVRPDEYEARIVDFFDRALLER